MSQIPAAAPYFNPRQIKLETSMEVFADEGPDDFMLTQTGVGFKAIDDDYDGHHGQEVGSVQAFSLPVAGHHPEAIYLELDSMSDDLGRVGAALVAAETFDKPDNLIDLLVVLDRGTIREDLRGRGLGPQLFHAAARYVHAGVPRLVAFLGESDAGVDFSTGSLTFSAGAYGYEEVGNRTWVRYFD